MKICLLRWIGLCYVVAVVSGCQTSERSAGGLKYTNERWLQVVRLR